MRLLTFILYCLVMASGFWTIQTQYNSRKLFIEIEQKRNHLKEIQQDNAILEVEKLTKAVLLIVVVVPDNETIPPVPW